MAEAKTESKSPLRLDQVQRGGGAAAAGFDGGGFGGELVVELVAVDGCGAAGAPGLAVEGDEADLGGGLVAAAAADEDGAVDEGELVVFLQEDDEAVGEFDALGLRGFEGVQRRDGDLASRAGLRLRASPRFRAGGCGLGVGGNGEEKGWSEGGGQQCIDEAEHRGLFILHLRCSVRSAVACDGAVEHGGAWGLCGGFLLGWDELDARAGAVAVGEDLVGDAANVGFGDGVDLVELAEELTPVAEAGLVLGELVGEAFVVGEAAQEVGAGAGLEAREFFVGDVFVLEAVEFFVDGGAHLVGGVAGEGHGVDGEEAGIFVAGEAAEALRPLRRSAGRERGCGRGGRCGRWRRCR